MTKNEIRNENDIITYECIPDENKCFKSKSNGHKFIHTNGKQGLPLYLTESDLDLYEEVFVEPVEEEIGGKENE